MPECTALTTPGDMPGQPAPAVAFEGPLEMLSAAHSQVETQCATLRRLVAGLAEVGADCEAREAAAAVMRGFDACAVHHHADEEVDLFPALIEAMAGSDAVCLRELTALLTAEHRELEQRWHALRGRLEQVALGHAVVLPGDEVHGFIDLCERHLAREEAELLPMAGRLISDAELDRIAWAMRTRRGAFGPTGLAKPSPA